MSNSQLILLRAVASILVSAAAAALALYPNETWLVGVISVAGTAGIHAIPAIQQGISTAVQTVIPIKPVTVAPAAVVATGGSTVPDETTPPTQANPPTQIDGLALMGLRAPVTDVEQPEATPPTVVPEAAPTPVESVSAPATDDRKQAVLDALASLGDAIKNL